MLNNGKKIKNDWPTIFPDLPVHVRVKVTTQGLGTMQNSLLKKAKGGIVAWY
ncbi:Ger(x)C family spore germination C-terminal domain-containing protein [Lysinibacillus sp. MHQ-1]|nr:Ger(x)C family spore germination C-terminal domain-containing protein [Lysinibacillus sp. MHQ-1]